MQEQATKTWKRNLEKRNVDKLQVQPEEDGLQVQGHNRTGWILDTCGWLSNV